MASSFQLRCLGGPALSSVSGEAVRFRTRKHLALLIRLALEPGKRLTRDHLTDLLWPDAPRPRANHSLAQGLSVLKAKVGREAIMLQRATVGLAPGVVDVDVAHLGNGNVDVAGPFLEGFEVPARPFEDWKDRCRARLLPDLRDCLVRQMDAARRIGDFATVELRARRLQELDPLAEEAVRGIMEARAWAGDRTNALHAFARYEAAAREALGARPGADLVRMADLLRDGRRSRARADAAPLPLAARRFEPETLIGREREFSVLYDAWIDARRKAPRMIVMTSDPGVGKTTLANAFVSSCQLDGAVVARAQAYDAERELPFVVLGELVRQLAAQRAIGGADPEALSELTRMTPEILRQYPGVPKPVEWSAELTPLRLADAFLKVVSAAAEDGPVVLVVDDIHGADNASTAILHMVARKLAEIRLLVILTARSSELRLSGAPAALTSDAAIEGLRPLELDVLPPDAAATLVARLAEAAERADPPTERILRAANGNPLAIELLTREWAAHGPDSLLRDLEALDTQPLPSIGIPRAIGVVFERQVQRLDATTRAALDLAAVLGRRLTDLALYAAVDLAPGQAGQALARLRDEGLLREVRGELEFRNELIRAQAYYAVAGTVRKQMHRAVAVLLTNNQYLGEGLEAAWHFVRGGEVELALPLVVERGEAALRAGAAAEVEYLVEAILKELRCASVSTSLRLLLANAALAQSNAPVALAQVDQLGEDSRLTALDKAHAALVRSAAEFLLSRNEGRGHRLAAERAVVLARESRASALVARALFEQARAATNHGDAVQLVRTQQALQDLLSGSPGADASFVHFANAYCYFHLGEPAKAIKELDRRIAYLEDSRDLDAAATAYGARGVSSFLMCALDDSESFLLKALELARRIGDDSRSSRTAANLAAVVSARGNHAQAVIHGTNAVLWGTRSTCQPVLVLAYTNLADVYARIGERAKATSLMQKAVEWTTNGRDWHFRIMVLCESASAALMEGNVELVLKITDEMERLLGGREPIVVHKGLMIKLRAYREVHASRLGEANAIAAAGLRECRGRLPLFYLDALAIVAWLEKLRMNSYSPETTEALGAFDVLGAPGKKELLQAQGFLS